MKRPSLALFCCASVLLIGANSTFAANSQATALYQKAQNYEAGVGVSTDLEQAFKLYQQAAELEHPEAMLRYALCLLQGIGAEPNSELGLSYLKKAAADGTNIEAVYQLGKYLMDLNDESVMPQALECFHQIKNCHPEAAVKIANCYMLGVGYDRNVDRAMQMYQQLADEGNPFAWEELAIAYEWGITGDTADKEKALRCYLKSAQLGGLAAMLHLGGYYDSINDEEQSANYYKQAADGGLAEAQYQISLYYLRGYGVEKNLKLAFIYAEKAAQQNYAGAQFNLASFYKNGIGTNQNLAKARYWYQKSIKNDPTKKHDDFEQLLRK